MRLSIAFDTTAESWLNQQMQYDLWRAERKRKKLRVKPLAAGHRRQPGSVPTVAGRSGSRASRPSPCMCLRVPALSRRRLDLDPDELFPCVLDPDLLGLPDDGAPTDSASNAFVAR